jgi:outer membrane protein OmpA-like peptidoglycan-associated protein
VFFDSGKSTLKPESAKELNELVEYMGLKKTMVVEIAGHTDNAGNKDANQKLSEERANAVRDYLIKKGIAADRVIAKGYGDTQPIADNTTEAGKQKNRRTEVRTIKE